MYQRLVCEDLTGDSVKRLTEVQGDNIHCSSLPTRLVVLNIEVYQVGQA